MDPTACNYKPEAELDNFTCFYATETTDCDGNCNEGYVADCNGDCGGTAVEDECGDCGGNGPTEGYDCDDNCLTQEVLFQVSINSGNATEWSVYDSNGTVVLSGGVPYSYNCDTYCGDLVCVFNYGECYTFEANGTFDGNVWISFPSADRNKVDEETYLILKNENGSDEFVSEQAKYKVISIANEAPDFIKIVGNIRGGNQVAESDSQLSLIHI